MHPSRPPALDALPSPRSVGCVRLVWWGRRGDWHGVLKGRGGGRAFFFMLALFWWPAVSLLFSGAVRCYRATSREVLHESRARLRARYSREARRLPRRGSRLGAAGYGHLLTLAAADLGSSPTLASSRMD